MTDTPHQSYPVSRSDFVLHGLFFAMASVVLILSVLMRSESGVKVFMPGMEFPMPTMCSAKLLFGYNCPGCGLTRAFIAISDGRFADAWNFNRASFAVYIFVAVQPPWHAYQLWRCWTGRRPIERAFIYLMPVFVAVVLTGNWMVYLLELL